VNIHSHKPQYFIVGDERGNIEPDFCWNLGHACHAPENNEEGCGRREEEWCMANTALYSV
jgi:hypothetical protein